PAPAHVFVGVPFLLLPFLPFRVVAIGVLLLLGNSCQLRHVAACQVGGRALPTRAWGAPAQPSLDSERTCRIRWTVVRVARSVMAARLAASAKAGGPARSLPSGAKVGSMRRPPNTAAPISPIARMTMRISRGARPTFAMPVPDAKPRLSA